MIHEWHKSSLSSGGDNCVEVGLDDQRNVTVRHSRDRGGPVLRFTEDEWTAFLGGVRLGEFG